MVSIFRWFSPASLMATMISPVVSPKAPAGSGPAVHRAGIGFKRVAALPLGILLALALAACIGGADGGTSGGIEGKFVSESNPKDYFQLSGHGSFTQEQGGLTFAGTYEINETEIILTLNSGAAGERTIFEVVLIDPDGEQWVKQVPNDFAFTLYQGQEDLGAESMNFSDLQGKPVVLNFWAGLCPPCRAEMPEFQEFYDEYHDRVILLGIDVGQFTSLGNRADGEALLKQLGVTYPAGFTEDPAIMRNFKVLGMPTTVFVDSEGEIFRCWTGALNLKTLSEIADEMLAQ